MSKQNIRSLATGLQSLRLLQPTTTGSSLPRTHPRPFTTTPSLATKTIRAKWIPSDLVPAYPYGERMLYKQSNHGLYGSARIRFGNIVSKGRTPLKTRRTWKPNVQSKRLYSAALGTWVRVRTVNRVLRSIRKAGGLDAYVLGGKAQRIKDLGPTGWKLRWLVLQAEGVAERHDAERRGLGLEVDGGKEKEREELRRIACDYATPGPLSKGTRELLARRRREAGEVEVALGEEAQGMEGEEEGGKGGEYEYESMPDDGPEAIAIKEREMAEAAEAMGSKKSKKVKAEGGSVLGEEAKKESVGESILEKN